MRKILGLLSLFQQRLNPSPDYFEIKKEMVQYPNIYDSKGPLILCQIVEDITFTQRLVHFVLAYQKIQNQKLNIGWVLIRKRIGAKSFRNKFRYAILNNSITDRVWARLYRSIGGKIVFRIDKDTSRKTDSKEWAKNIQNSLKCPEEILKIEVDSILVGDLIYDTYLRFKPAPTVDLADPLLGELLDWTWDLYHQTCHFLNKNTVSAVVTSYTSYIHHGLLARVALSRNIPVYSLGAYNQLIVQPTQAFPYHKRNFHQYKTYFSTVEDKGKAIEKGLDLIQRRTSGVVDPATSYMATSAYHADSTSSLSFSEGNKKRAIVMGHDFYDSPHIYGDMIFPDFFEWLRFIFEQSKSSVYEFYYKPHPNGLPENDILNLQLREQFPHVKFIDKTVSNKILVKNNFEVAFSVYGTIAHEFSFQGLPVISCGSNPHQVYRFNICANSKDELHEYITGKKCPKLDAAEVPEFCFVHNYRFLNGSLELFPFNISKNAKQYFSRHELEKRVGIMVENYFSRNSL